MPKKRGAASLKGYADAEARFLARTAAAIAAHVDFARVRCLLIAGPGFTRDKVREYLLSHGGSASGGAGTSNGVDGTEGASRMWQRHKDVIISASASTAYLQAIPVRLVGACFGVLWRMDLWQVSLTSKICDGWSASTFMRALAWSLVAVILHTLL